MIDVQGYDRTRALSAEEIHHMQILVTRFQDAVRVGTRRPDLPSRD